MTSSTKSIAINADHDDYMITESIRASSGDVSYQRSSTATARGLLRRSGLLAPFVALAAFAAPAPEQLIRRSFSDGGRSRSESLAVHWAVDEWVYTEERGSLDQVETLNALLALPAHEGFRVDLPD